jgi:hypothetical protein
MPSEIANSISLRALVGQIAIELESTFSTGDIAELRRLSLDNSAPPIFWRIVISHLDSSLPSHGNLRSEMLRRWTTILRSMAELTGLHDAHTPLGRAMAETGVAEMRVLKLLRASGDLLLDAVRAVAHQLGTNAVVTDQSDLARLVLSDGRSDEQSVRQQIAYDYYAQLRRIERESA